VLNMGLARETGRVWFNGTEVSRFDLVYRFWDAKTAAIPASLVKAGANNSATMTSGSAMKDRSYPCSPIQRTLVSRGHDGRLQLDFAGVEARAADLRRYPR